MAKAAAISRKLGTQYFRSVDHGTAIRGWYTWNTGFEVKQSGKDSVRVEHRFGSSRVHASDEVKKTERDHMLAKYAAVLEGRYTVTYERGTLVVTDKPKEA